eukprot:Hpha_TRINITY_DN1627_c0_g1::TRINITY_DN1627_c0_g1_i1::g.48873::m.48873
MRALTTMLRRRSLELYKGGGVGLAIAGGRRGVGMPAEKGGVVVHDYRVWHRGVGNRDAGKARPLLYFTLSTPGFVDGTNYTAKRGTVHRAELAKVSALTNSVLRHWDLR